MNKNLNLCLLKSIMHILSNYIHTQFYEMKQHITDILFHCYVYVSRSVNLYLLQIYYTTIKLNFTHMKLNFTKLKLNSTNIEIVLTKVKFNIILEKIDF